MQPFFFHHFVFKLEKWTHSNLCLEEFFHPFSALGVGMCSSRFLAQRSTEETDVKNFYRGPAPMGSDADSVQWSRSAAGGKRLLH
jgi:hypothetical protein